MKKLLILFTLTCSFSINAQNNESLITIVNELNSIDEEFRLDRSQGHPEKYNFQKVENIIERAEKKRPYIQKLNSIPDNELDEQDQINKSILLLQLNNELSYVDFKRFLVPINAEGGFYNSPTFMLRRLPFNTEKDYQSYIKWIPSFVEYLTYNQELLKQGMEEKIVPAKIVVENMLSLLEPWTQDDPTQHPFYQPFLSFPKTISEESQNELIAKGKKIISKSILPAYKELKQFTQKEYLPSATENPGVVNISNGKKFYEDRIRFFTTLDINPDSVFNLGMSEVERIKQQMNNVIIGLEYDGSFSDFIEFLRTDPQFYASSEQELLNYAAWLSKKAEGQLPTLFGDLYSLPFTVAPVPASIAPNYTGGRYVPGSRSQNRPGTYWVNTSKLNSRTLYTLPALTLHEAVPGHHLQISMASELKDFPDFRKGYYISAYGEGWGLYSEYLGEEMGMYETPYDLFGRYTYEMWRACRLVVDVGIHYKNWSREKAVKFLSDNTALSLHEVNTEIDRYIGWPGQAVSYKIGEITIKKLRKDAETTLGNDFDIQKFHEIILKNGAVPLPVLVEQVNNYIKDAKS